MKKAKVFLGLLIGALVFGFTACQQGTQDVNVVDQYDKNDSGIFEIQYECGDKWGTGTFSYVKGDGSAKNSNFYILTLKLSDKTYTFKKRGNIYFNNTTGSTPPYLKISGNFMTGTFTILNLESYYNLKINSDFSSSSN